MPATGWSRHWVLFSAMAARIRRRTGANPFPNLGLGEKDFKACCALSLAQMTQMC